MTDDDTAMLIRELSEKVVRLEDRQEIIDLMTSYGPAIDSGDAEAVAHVWTEDGVYDVDTGVLRGRNQIQEMVRGQRHQGYVQGGCAHVLEPGSVVIDGNTAVATCKSMLIVSSGDDSGFTVLRATANRWELVRTSGRWKCRRRMGRVLDGRAGARDLLAQGIRDARE
ncbi:MAG: nuclear transport factor 2 family protein [Tomitella sp.]|nr:nuclear transport factor 2 family protein [Tomitella sp.]